jgi:hypothetical protein
MTQLLDLPPELWQHVVHYLVLETGMKEVWRLRGVGRTFKRDITDNIVTKQPPEAFWSATTIWKSIIGQYFFYRANNTKVKDITTELPSAFNKMADYLVAKLKLNTGRCKESLETPCKGVVNTSNAFFSI